MTVTAALRDAAKLLESVSDTPRLDAELLMAQALGQSRSAMLLHGSDLEAPDTFAEFVGRRIRHEPVAYIIGSQEFYGRNFCVNAEVLIPRADSETIVDVVLAQTGETGRVLDLGTGSGALLLTVLAEKPEMTGIGIDRSLGALAMAASNAARLGTAERARMIRGDWHIPGWADDLGLFDLIIANPPYVETTIELDRSVREYEPAGALFAGGDGLNDYRALIPQLRNLLTPDGQIVLEIGHSQDASVAAIARNAGFTTELFRDLAHRPRALLLR